MLRNRSASVPRITSNPPQPQLKFHSTDPETGQIMRRVGKLPCEHRFQLKFIYNWTLQNRCCPVDGNAYEAKDDLIFQQGLQQQIQAYIAQEQQILDNYRMRQFKERFGNISKIMSDYLSGKSAEINGEDIKLAVKYGLYSWAEIFTRLPIQLYLQSINGNITNKDLALERGNQLFANLILWSSQA